MRNYSFILFISTIILFSACANKNESEHAHDRDGNHIPTEGVHEHEDGSVHQNHHDVDHTQEEFRIESDSASIKKEEAGHSHEDGSHQH